MRVAFILFAALLTIALPPEQAPALELGRPTPLSDAALATPLTDMAGDPVDLADYHGQVVVLNFWATWCGPCRLEMPSIGRLQAAFEGKDLTVIAIAVDRANVSKIEAFMQQTQSTNLTVLRDTTMSSMKGFGLRGLPATIILDTNGNSVARHDGFEEWDKPEIVEALTSLLPSPS